MPTFRKILVANRREIAIRAFRAAHEVTARTLPVFPHEDRWSEHRLKADEAYQIGEIGHPVRARGPYRAWPARSGGQDFLSKRSRTGAGLCPMRVPADMSHSVVAGQRHALTRL